MKGVIDRIKEDVYIIELDDKTIVKIPIEGKVCFKDGDRIILSSNNGQYHIAKDRSPAGRIDLKKYFKK